MPLPEGHWRSVAEPAKLRGRERWLIGGVIAGLVVLVVALAISFSTGGSESARGCIDVTVQGPVGGTQLHRCGAEARALCSSAAAGAATGNSLARALPEACRKAGLPIGS